VCATSTKVIAREREREIRVSANRSVGAIQTPSLATSVRVEPFSPFTPSLPFRVSTGRTQFNEEEIMHQLTTNFTLAANALLLVHTRIHIYIYIYIYSVCRRDIYKTDTKRFHASDHHHHYHHRYYCFVLSPSTTPIQFYFSLWLRRRNFFSSLFSHSFLHSSLTVHSCSLLPSSSSVLIHQLHIYIEQHRKDVELCV
jgi:hypothetical protein